MQVCLELVYRLVSKTSARKGLRDRGPPPAPNPKADRAHGFSCLTVDGIPVSRGLARWQLKRCFSVKCDTKDMSGVLYAQFKELYQTELTKQNSHIDVVYKYIYILS